MRCRLTLPSRATCLVVASAVGAQVMLTAAPSFAADREVSTAPPLLASAAAAIARARIDPPVDDCTRELAAAKSRRGNGRAMTTVGVVASLYGYVALTSSIGRRCPPASACTTTRDRNVGFGLLAGGLTLAGVGHVKSHDADTDVAALVAQAPCVDARAAALAIADTRRSLSVTPSASPGTAAQASTSAPAAWSRVVDDAKARRSSGYKQLAIGLVTMFVGQQLVLRSTHDGGGVLIGALASTVGLTTAITGHLKARDAGHDLDALTARGPSPPVNPAALR